MNYFYCYDRELMKYLRYENNIQFICTALHQKTMDQFWLFERSDQLYASLNTFLEHRKTVPQKMYI
jgi:hypothetical protein